MRFDLDDFQNRIWIGVVTVFFGVVLRVRWPKIVLEDVKLLRRKK